MLPVPAEVATLAFRCSTLQPGSTLCRPTHHGRLAAAVWLAAMQAVRRLRPAGGWARQKHSWNGSGQTPTPAPAACPCPPSAARHRCCHRSCCSETRAPLRHTAHRMIWQNRSRHNLLAAFALQHVRAPRTDAAIRQVRPAVSAAHHRKPTKGGCILAAVRTSAVAGRATQCRRALAVLQACQEGARLGSGSRLVLSRRRS